MTTPTRHTTSLAKGGRQEPSSRMTEDIPLQTRNDTFSPSHDADRNRLPSAPFHDDDENDPDPFSDSSYLRRHRRSSLSESDEEDSLGGLNYRDSENIHAYERYNDDGLGQEDYDWSRPPPTVGQRFLNLMSRAPLLLRTSPAFGSSSYGAVPPQQDDDDNMEDDTRREGQEAGSTVYTGIRSRRPDGAAGGPGVARSRRGSGKRVRRSSSTASDIGMGPESKSSIATGTVMPGRAFLDDVTASSSGDDGDGDGVVDVEEEDDKTTDENPPDNSPYAQVRASVSATDDTSLSINTPRMWVLSLLFSLTGSATNLFFSLRYPSVSITPVIALVLVHPLGKLWDAFLKRKIDPPEVFENGVLLRREWPMDIDQLPKMSKSHRLRLWLGQGHWNEKEHACVYISSNVSFGFAFATDVIVEQHKFYKQDVPILYQILLTISTQILGYAFAGITRRFLVRPASMIWPGTLMSTAMFSTMHRSENKLADGWRVTRYRFFVIVWAGAFLWYFVPGLLMPALSYFNVITWLAPKSVVVANLFGVSSGLGMFPITFDWAQIAYIGSPLLTPWWAAANMVTGLAVVMWLVAPVLYYKNVLFASYLPMLSSSVFDNTGKPYEVQRILTPDFLFDEEAYKKYSSVYLPITYALSYAVQFAALSALVTHTICWYGKDIWNQSKMAWSEWQQGREVKYQPIPNGDHDSQTPLPSQTPVPETTMGGEDVHCRLMRRYEDAPLMWYLMTFIAMLAISIFVVEYYPVYLPWYGLLLALCITILLFIPVGIVMAITNQHSSLYLICQLICGIVFPGRPVANMVFVTYSYISSAQGIKFSSDLKLGHYMKIPPKILFTVQMVATLVSSMTQIGVLNWMFSFIPGICTPEAINGFICPIARVHFNGSILWGVVGPQRFFGAGGIYRPLVWAFLVGALGPIGVWLLGRRSKKNIWRMVNLPVLFGGLSWIPPATGLNFSVWALVCFLFNHVVRRRAPAWWGKYTMTMSAALDSGLAFAVIFIFFGFIYPGWMEGFTWWGTEIYKQGCDWMACPYLKLAPGEKFAS